MARWIQMLDKDSGEYKLVPADEAAVKRDEGLSIFVKGNFDAFVSPVDRSLIRTQRELDDHNRRNGVVDAREFSQEFFERKAKERAKFYQGEYTRQEKLARKRQINEIINLMERKNG